MKFRRKLPQTFYFAAWAFDFALLGQSTSPKITSQGVEQKYNRGHSVGMEALPVYSVSPDLEFVTGLAFYPRVFLYDVSQFFFTENFTLLTLEIPLRARVRVVGPLFIESGFYFTQAVGPVRSTIENLTGTYSHVKSYTDYGLSTREAGLSIGLHTTFMWPGLLRPGFASFFYQHGLTNPSQRKDLNWQYRAFQLLVGFRFDSL